MFDNLDRTIQRLGDKIADATVEGIEKGARILAKAITDKLDELHERDYERSKD